MLPSGRDVCFSLGLDARPPLAAHSLRVGRRLGGDFSLYEGFDACVAVVNSFVDGFRRVWAPVTRRLLSGFLDAFPRVFDIGRHCKPA